LVFFFGGTGSYPLVPHGLHLDILFIVSHNPLKGPWIFKASTAYCEQVGICLQEEGVSGDMQYL